MYEKETQLIPLVKVRTTVMPDEKRNGEWRGEQKGRDCSNTYLPVATHVTIFLTTTTQSQIGEKGYLISCELSFQFFDESCLVNSLVSPGETNAYHHRQYHSEI